VTSHGLVGVEVCLARDVADGSISSGGFGISNAVQALTSRRGLDDRPPFYERISLQEIL
jgi:hypothetical protein